MNTESPVIQCIFKRRSVRKLKPDPLPDQDMNLMLECLQMAPSAGNIQPWFFYIVKDQALKDRLCTLSFDQKVVAQAPVVFVVCARPLESAKEYGDLGRDFFCIQDTAAAVQNLLLAVHAMGYGAVWIGVVKEKEIAACLGLPENERPVALIPVGLADESPAFPGRKSLDKISRVLG
ncbi:MAG: nitroreductase family protein [Deltaproteobacteria bacterium]|nr:nitroreductase family protein [Deltaproteobacteria bacterium]